MSHFKTPALIFAFFSGTALVPAAAQEIRFGLTLHDTELAEDILGGRHGKEESWALNGEYLFDSPDFLGWAFSPNPYLGGTLNLEGKTSYGGGGLHWRIGHESSLYASFAFGLVVHNGEIRTPNPATGQTYEEILELLRRKQTEIEFGSRVLFREDFAVGYRLNQNWATEFSFEHLSHGQILGGPENEGSNAFTLRLARRMKG